MMAGPVQHFQSAILDAWRSVFSPSYLSGRVFWVVSSLILQLLTSSQLRERDKMLLRAILCGVFGTDSFKARPRRKTFLVDFVVTGMEMATYSGSVLFTAFSMLGIFLSLLLNRSNWTRCLLWHGWLPGLSGLCDKDPWASSFGDLAFSNLERCLGLSG